MTGTATEPRARRNVLRAAGVALALVLLVLAVVVWQKGDRSGESAPGVDPETGKSAEPAGPAFVLGRVTDSTGTPLAGVKVWGISATGFALLPAEELTSDRIGAALRARRIGTSTRTDEDGTYRLRVAANAQGPYRLAFEPGDDEHAWTFSGGAAHLLDAELVETDVGEVTQDVAVPAVGTISGRIAGPWQQKPGRPDWTVSAIRVGGEEPRVIRATALRSRTWTLDGLAPGKYWVSATSARTGDLYAPAAVRPEDAVVVEVGAGERVTGVDVWARAPGRVAGQVRDRAGRPLGDVDVFLVAAVPLGSQRAEASVVATTRTDAKGRWRATAPTGEYQVHLHADPRSCFSVKGPGLSVAAGRSTTYVLTTDRRARISGEVTLTAGMPYAGISLVPKTGVLGPKCSLWLPDVDRVEGSFELTGAPRGRYRLEFVDPNGMALNAVGSGKRSPERLTVRNGMVVEDLDVELAPALPGG